MTREKILFIEDILDCILKIEQFIKDMTYEEFCNDEKTASAVMRKIEIIGEASKNIPSNIKQKYKDIPWRNMAKIRNKLIHAYFHINYAMVWKTIKEKFPELKEKIQLIIKNEKNKVGNENESKKI